jgi:hypothetical protein
MTSWKYEVSAEPTEPNRESLCRLWRDNLELEQTPGAKFDWLYRAAPVPNDAVFMLRAVDELGKVSDVGTCGVIPRRYWAAGQVARFGVIGDLAVDLEHRRLLPALGLTRAVFAAVGRDFDVAYGFPNQKADRTMLRAGFRELGRMRRYVHVLHHAVYVHRVAERVPRLPRLLARALQGPMAARIAGALLDVAGLSSNARSLVHAAMTHRLEWADGFDETFDQLWENARSEYAVVGERTSAFLRWRYPRATIAKLLRRGSRSAGEGTLVAYAIVELDRANGTAHLRDLFGHHSAFGPLIDLLLPALHARGAASVSVRLLGAPEVLLALESRGFELRDEGGVVIVAVGAKQRELAAVFESAANWHLFDEDEDVG